MKQNRTIIAITLDKKLFLSIEEKRGLIPRSRYVEKMILEGMKLKND